MGTRIASFSNFVIELNQRTPQDTAEGLAKWAVAELSETLGFDAAWYGWATLRPQGPEIYANATYNLPDDFYLHWLSMSDQDLLVRAMIENPGNVAIYDRAQRRQTDGMADLSDRYGLTRMTTAMNGGVSDFASFYLSSYRTGKSASSWSEEDREFLQCAVRHLAAAMQISEVQKGRSGIPGSVSVLASESGIGVLCLDLMRERFGDIWPRWSGYQLPEQLQRLIDRPGTHVLPELDLVVTVDPAPMPKGMGLRRLTLRRLTRADLLTSRQREVAQALASGKSAKEVARLLGLAPATVRNQTASIYEKLQVDNRAELASALQGASV